jgi:predicted PurR-regulated permease PerM
MDQIGQAVGGFFRGQPLVALFVGVASSIGLWIIGLPFWLPVGIVAGVFNLVHRRRPGGDHRPHLRSAPQLHPVVVMLALLAGASVAGLFGMLVIVPLVAVAKIVFLFIWSRYVDYGDELTQGAPD